MADPLSEKKSNMLNRGTLTILGILLLGASMASVAVWYHAGTGQRCLQVWGVDGARLIRHAPQVEAIRLARPDEAPSDGSPTADAQGVASEKAGLGEQGEKRETLTLGDRRFIAVERVDISQARGLLHARHALIMDHNFHFESSTAAGEPPDWKYAVRFVDGAEEVLLAFAPQDDRVGLFPRDATLRLRTATMTAETALLEREFARLRRESSNAN